MDWRAFSVRRGRSIEYLRHPAAVRGLHQAVLDLLAEREAGPILPGLRSWTRRDLDRALACTPGELEKLVASGLARWCGDGERDLFVNDHDEGGEARVKKARESGLKGAISKWSKASDPMTNPSGPPSGEANEVADARYQPTNRTNGTNEKESPAAPRLRASGRSKKEFGPEVVAVAESLLRAIREHTPSFEADTSKWLEQIDLAIRVDGRSVADLERIIEHAHRGAGTFWRPNILSGEKLRKQAQRLLIEIDSGQRPKSSGAKGYAPYPTNTWNEQGEVTAKVSSFGE